jgi:hypothetical protein
VVSHALWRLDRATTVAWKAVHLAEVADDQWQLVKQVIGIGRGWEAADRLICTLDLRDRSSPPTGPPEGPRHTLECSAAMETPTPSVVPGSGGVRRSGAA